MKSNSTSITPKGYSYTASYDYDKIIFEVEPVFQKEGEQINDILLRLMKQDLESL